MGFTSPRPVVGYADRAAARRRRWILCATLAGSVGLVAGCGASHGGRTLRAASPTTSTTTRPVVTTTTVPYVSYRVQRGDTLTRIADKFRVSASSIVGLNHLANPDMLPEGQILKIPPAPPLALVVTPRSAPAGEAFRLTLTGATPGGQVTFEVHSPKAVFTGRAHTATADGTVKATYQTSTTDPTGTFIVVAKGAAGPLSQTTFVVSASTPVT